MKKIYIDILQMLVVLLCKYILLLDLKHICQNLDQFGHGKGTIYGGCSEYTIIPAKYAYLLKTNLSDEKAAILERKPLNLSLVKIV